MTSRQINRFVDTTAPAVGSSQGVELQNLEKKYSLDQAVLLFKKERTESAMMKNACNLAESLLSQGRVGQNLGNLSSLNHNSKVAIVAFTLDKDFNSRSRNLTTSPWENFPYQGMWLLLNKAILSHGNLPSSITVYRGIGSLINAVSNTTFCFRQIASTSSTAAVAQGFTSGQGTLYVLDIKRGLRISALSKFPGEEEYILPAYGLFKVTGVVRSVSEISIFNLVSTKSDCIVNLKQICE